jgi:cytochrome c biogenesis protein CcdA/thiol-disulfide isomerase/thioredoxin
MVLLLLISFVSGFVTILAPCIWPLLPIVLSSSINGNKSKSLGITLGILITFGFFTLSVSYLVFLFKFDPGVLRLMAALVIGFFGLTLAFPYLTKILESRVSFIAGKFSGFGNSSNRGGFVGGLTVGLALGLVWTPCAGPILATIATLAATRAVNFGIILVTGVYLIGVGIPLFFFSVVSSTIFEKSKILNKYTGRVQMLFGVLMIFMALAIYSGYDRLLEAKFLDLIPSYSTFLTKIETTGGVQTRLDKLKGNVATIQKSNLGVVGNAPDFIGITNWLNSKPISMQDLKGKVVLVDFWTYTCINCIRTLPYVTSWYEKYHSMGFVVIGVHTPEFEFEKNTQNVENALRKYKINYPVAQDNDYKTWNNFNNQYWPAKYLIDASGKIRYTHFGEGDYEKTEQNIQDLIKEAGQNINVEINKDNKKSGFSFAEQITPETYLGLKRLDRFASNEQAAQGEHVYTLVDNIPLHDFGYLGTWNLSDEFGECALDCSLSLNFNASKVYLVITPQNSGEKVEVNLDGNKVGKDLQGADVRDGVVNLDSSRLYNLIDLGSEPKKHILKLNFSNRGTRIFAFTFG